MSKMSKRAVILAVILTVLAALPFGAALADTTTLSAGDIDEAIYKTVDYYQGAGAPTDEWVVFALNAAGEDVNKTPYLDGDGDNFGDNFTLADTTINDYAKAILAYESIGKDTTTFVDGLASCDMGGIVYINTAAYALMALDAAGAPSDDSDNLNREDLITYIMDHKIDGVCWGYSWGGVDYTDVDTTAQMITALAPYYDRTEVKNSVDPTLTWLNAQDFSGNSSSISQVVCALTALGLNPQTWQTDNMVSDLIACQMADGQFEYYGSANAMATYQSLTALAAARQYIESSSDVYIYQDVTYHERNVIAMRIEDAGSTVLEETVLQCPVDATLSEAVEYVITTKGLSGIEVTGTGSIVDGDDNIYHAFINSDYSSGDPAVEAGDEILLYTGTDTAMIGRVILTNSIDHDNNLVSPDDTVTVTVEGLDSVGSWSAVSGVTVYVDDSAVGTTNTEGQTTFSIDDTGSHEVWAREVDAYGDAVLVKTEAETVEVADNVTVTFRMEGLINAYYPDGTIVEEVTLEVPDGSSTIFAIKRALDLAGIDNTIDINDYIHETDIALLGDTVSPGYMYQVNDNLDWTQTVTAGDSIVLYMSYYNPSTYEVITSYAKIEADDYQINAGDTVTLTVSKSDNGWPASYIPAEGVEIYIDGERLEDGLGDAILTDSNGQVAVTLADAKKYSIYAREYDGEGIPQIVKTGKITVYAGLNIEFIDAPSGFSLGEDADVTVRITNGQTEDVEGLVIVALYNTSTDQMVNYSYVSKTIAAGSFEQFTAGFAIPDSGNYQVKVLIWDDWDSMTPLSDSLTIPVA